MTIKVALKSTHFKLAQNLHKCTQTYSNTCLPIETAAQILKSSPKLTIPQVIVKNSLEFTQTESTDLLPHSYLDQPKGAMLQSSPPLSRRRLLEPPFEKNTTKTKAPNKNSLVSRLLNIIQVSWAAIRYFSKLIPKSFEYLLQRGSTPSPPSAHKYNK